MGAKAGEERAVNAKFPDDYPEKTLAGKDAVFKVKVKEVAKPIKPELNDEFAKTLGAESRWPSCASWSARRIASEYASISRMKLKRQILDELDKAHDFALPETLVESEFEGIWEQLQQNLEADRQDARPTRARPRTSCARSTARSPSGACASASSSARSARRTRSRSARTSCAGP